MENQKRHLEVAVVKVEGDQVTFRIAEQTHREDDFTANGRKFKSSCGVMLNSLSSPEYSGCTTLYVRGYAACMDDKEITVSLHNFAGIMQAISEYNETNGAGYKKPWPQKGDICYFVSISGLIDSFAFPDDSYGRKLKEFGNLFRTYKEAEAARERVKKALKGE